MHRNRHGQPAQPSGWRGCDTTVPEGNVVQLVRFDLGDDGFIVAEVDDTEPGVDRAARGSDRLRTAAASFEQVRAFSCHRRSSA